MPFTGRLPNFEQNSVYYRVDFKKTGNGRIKVDGVLHDLPYSVTNVPAGTPMTFEGVPDSGWHFVNFTGTTSDATNPKTINVNGNEDITANFVSVR